VLSTIKHLAQACAHRQTVPHPACAPAWRNNSPAHYSLRPNFPSRIARVKLSAREFSRRGTYITAPSYKVLSVHYLGQNGRLQVAGKKLAAVTSLVQKITDVHYREKAFSRGGGRSEWVSE